MKHVLASGAISVLLLATSIPSFAQSTSTGLHKVNANVSSSCTVSSANLEIKRKVNTLRTDIATKATESITVTCTKGTPVVTLRRDMGLNTICKQNGLWGEELLLKSENGDFLPYRHNIQSHTMEGVLVSGTGSWKCDTPDNDPKMNFSTASQHTFIFEMIAGATTVPVSAEALRLFYTAPVGTYTDTLTFSVVF